MCKFDSSHIMIRRPTEMSVQFFVWLRLPKTKGTFFSNENCTLTKFYPNWRSLGTVEVEKKELNIVASLPSLQEKIGTCWKYKQLSWNKGFLLQFYISWVEKSSFYPTFYQKFCFCWFESLLGESKKETFSSKK